MQNKAVHILATADLPKPAAERALRNGIQLDIVPFISIEDINDRNVVERVKSISTKNISAVFTSRNAVRAVSNMLEGISPSWKIFCIEGATSESIKAHFHHSTILATNIDAHALSLDIVAQHPEEVYFFCGELRREEIPDVLKAHNIPVHIVEVYKTLTTPSLILKAYDGILFFSPSAVDSFFSQNKIPTGTVLFAIGNTTAAAIKNHGIEQVIVPDTASREVLLDEAVNFLTKKLNPHSTDRI